MPLLMTFGEVISEWGEYLISLEILKCFIISVYKGFAVLYIATLGELIGM